MPKDETSGLQQQSIDAMPLSELISALKRDLWESSKKSDGIPAMFNVTEATIEASVFFQRANEVGGKISVWVAEFGPKSTETSQSLHKISIKLVPIRPETAPDATPTPSPNWVARGGPSQLED